MEPEFGHLEYQITYSGESNKLEHNLLVIIYIYEKLYFHLDKRRKNRREVK